MHMTTSSDNTGRSHIPPSPIDISALLERCMGNAEVAMMVLDRLAEQIEHDLAELTSAADHNDTRALTHTAHALRGAAGTAAAGQLTLAASRVESLAKSNPTEVPRAELETLVCQAKACEAAIAPARRVLTQTRNP